MQYLALLQLASRLYGYIDGLEQVAHALEGVEQKQHSVCSAEVVYAVCYHLVRHQSVLYEVQVLYEVGELANVHHLYYGIPYVCRHVQLRIFHCYVVIHDITPPLLLLVRLP